LALALDESRDTDEIFEENGYKFCIDAQLYNTSGGITVDAGYMGFSVQSANPLNAASGSSCGGCGSSCST